MKTLRKLIEMNLVDLIMIGIVLGLFITYLITGLDVSRVLWIVIPYIFVATFRCYYLRGKVERFKQELKLLGYETDPDNEDGLIDLLGNKL